jgi:prepilin-type N-terminal cleavage/methylation domain-containing protein
LWPVWKNNSVHCNKPNPHGGFTLIEVLVSVTMMAVVATVVVSAMRSGMSMWDRGTAHIETLRHSRIVLDVLNDQIRGALPLTYTIRADQSQLMLVAFEGTRTGLRFVTRTSFKDGPDGIPRWVDIHWTGDSLIVEEHRILPPDNTPDPGVYWRGAVYKGEGCTFDYLLNAQPNMSAQWLQESHNSPSNLALPKAVRLNCVLQNKAAVRSIVALDYASSSAAGLLLR